MNSFLSAMASPNKHHTNGGERGETAAQRTLRAPVDELSAILQKLPWNIGDLSQLVRHDFTTC